MHVVPAAVGWAGLPVCTCVWVASLLRCLHDAGQQPMRPCLSPAHCDVPVNVCVLQVAVVGTGASAIQAIPKLQQIARELVVFQVCAVWRGVGARCVKSYKGLMRKSYKGLMRVNALPATVVMSDKEGTRGTRSQPAYHRLPGDPAIVCAGACSHHALSLLVLQL